MWKMLKAFKKLKKSSELEPLSSRDRPFLLQPDRPSLKISLRSSLWYLAVTKLLLSFCKYFCRSHRTCWSLDRKERPGRKKDLERNFSFRNISARSSRVCSHWRDRDLPTRILGILELFSCRWNNLQIFFENFWKNELFFELFTKHEVGQPVFVDGRVERNQFGVIDCLPWRPEDARVHRAVADSVVQY